MPHTLYNFIYSSLETHIVSKFSIVAKKYNDSVFDGFVRDVIVQHTKRNVPLDYLYFKGINFLFITQRNANRYVDKLTLEEKTSLNI